MTAETSTSTPPRCTFCSDDAGPFRPILDGRQLVCENCDAPRPEGGQLLDEAHAALIKYVAFPSAEAADAVALFVAATHAQPAWEHATRLVVKSPLKRCGKTRLLEVVSALCRSVIRTSNVSPAALVRSIGADDPPTLILDEADTIFAQRRGERSEAAETIRGIVNAGHARGWPYLRWDVKARQTEECPTFAMVVLGGIGDLPDTIEDRAVIVEMRRRAPGEQVAQWRTRRAVPPLEALRDRLGAWVRSILRDLEEADPALPVADRAADTWEPLVAIADAAGGRWPERARRACEALTTGGEPDDATAGERLLLDLATVFRDDETALFTTEILDRLHRFDESPWGNWYGRELNARDLARLLRPFGVSSRNVRIGGSQAKGYDRADLLDPWQRYTPQASHRPERPTVPDQLDLNGDNESGRDGPGTDAAETSVPSDSVGAQPVETDRDGGTAGTDPHVDDATEGGACWRCGDPLSEDACLACEVAP